MPNDRSPSWKIFLPLGIVLVLAVTWTAYWFIALGFARDRLSSERTRLSEQGYELTCSTEEWGGFPFRFEFSCQSPEFALADTVQLKSQAMLVVALAYAPWQVVTLIDGPTEILSRSGLAERIEHARAMAVFTAKAERKTDFSAEIRDITSPSLGNAERLMIHSRPSPQEEGEQDIAVTLANATYQLPGLPALELKGVNVLGTVGNGRSLTIRKAEVQSGKVILEGSGQLTLDAEHRITGEITATTNDTAAMLEVGAPYLGLSDQQKTQVLAVLGLLGSAAEIPIIAKNGQLYLGPFKVAELGSLY